MNLHQINFVKELAKKIDCDSKISKSHLEQHLRKNSVLDSLWSSVPISHEGELEAAWLSHPGDGDIQLTVSEGLRPHPQSYMAQSLTWKKIFELV